MCYDIHFKMDMEEVTSFFKDIVIEDNVPVTWEYLSHIMGHAYGLHPIVYVNRDSMKVSLREMEWGIIPHFTKDEKAFVRQRAKYLNIRSERILDDPSSYWYKIRNRRCLIPISGFYEHREIAGWKKKVPYFIKVKGRAMMLVAGLYSFVDLPDLSTGELVKRSTFGLITRGANEIMAQIHNGGDNPGRMPLMLTDDLAHEWLREDLTIENYRKILGFEMPAEALAYHTVCTIRTPKMRPDEKDKDEFWMWEGLPELVA